MSTKIATFVYELSGVESTIKVCKIGEQPYKDIIETDMILFGKTNTTIKNNTTGEYETPKYDHCGYILGTGLRGFETEVQPMKGLVIKSTFEMQTTNARVALHVGYKFYVVIDSVCSVISVVSAKFWPESILTLDLTESLCHNLYLTIKTMLGNQAVDAPYEVIHDATTKGDTKDPREDSTGDIKSDIKSDSKDLDGLQSSITRSTNTIDKHLPLFEVVNVYGIEMWRPASYIKDEAVFSIYLDSNCINNVIIAHKTNNGYTIMPGEINKVTNCIKMAFGTRAYAIGFASENNEKNIFPKIRDIEMSINVE